MRKILITLLYLIFGGSYLYAQEIKSQKFGINYCIGLNTWSIKTMNETLVKYNFTHSFNFSINKKLKKENEISYGLNYQYLYGDSEVKNYTTYSCSGSGLINFSKYYEIRQNIFQLYVAYQLKPLNKKKNFFLRAYAQPGFAIETSYSHYTPELPCQGYTNRKDIYKNLSFSGGLSCINQICKTKNFAVSLNYGVVYQWIDLYLLQVNPIVGMELRF